MNSGTKVIYDKLDTFIKKYYYDKLLKGLLLSTASIVACFLFIVNLSYFNYLSVGVRTFLFYSFLVTSGIILCFYILIPISKLLNYSKTLTKKEAAQIISNHFSEIKDRLINFLELEHSSTIKDDLLLAAIDQKADNLKAISFVSAVDYNKNKPFLFLLSGLLFLTVCIFYFKPSILTRGSEKIIHHSKEYQREFPFTITLENKNLKTIQNNDFKLLFSINGTQVPQQFFIHYNGLKQKVKKESKNQFSYTFSNVQNTIDFVINEGKYDVFSNRLKVLKKPLLKSFSASIIPPKHTKIKKSVIKNTGSFTIPEGSKITWHLKANNTSDVFFDFDTKVEDAQKKEETFLFSKQILTHNNYKIITFNKDNQIKDSIDYQIQVIKDQYPNIDVETYNDSLHKRKLYFSGSITDDYGFKNLEFIAKIISKEEVKREIKQSIKVNTDNAMNFKYLFDFSKEELEFSDKISYYFRVTDNDRINGYKSTKSTLNQYKIPSKEDWDKKKEELADKTKQTLNQSEQQANQMKKEIEKLWEDILDQKNDNWQNKSSLNELLDKHEQLENKLKSLNNENKKQLSQQNALDNKNQKQLEKQEQIQELMDKLLSDQMKDMMNQIKEMLEKIDQNKQINEDLEEFKLSNEDLEKELDRTLELFKQIEFEEKMQSSIDKLEQLKEKQKELSKNELSDEKEQQKELSNQMNELSEDLDKLKELNESLEYPNQMPEEMDALSDQIQEEQQNAQDNLEKNNANKANQNQDNAAKKLDELSKQMQMSMQENQNQAAEENLDDMRQLMENLVYLSFEQEKLMKAFKKTSTKDPRFNSMVQAQYKLKDDAKHIEDSLFALSKRVPEIQSIVNKELNALNQMLDASILHLSNRRTSTALTKQQSAMTNANNLALLFDEIIQQMQQQMQKQQGNGSCSKPGGSGKPSAGALKKMQEGLNKQLEKLQKELAKQGPKQGQGSGEKSGGSMSEKLMKMAAEQEQIRQMLQEAQNELSDGSSGAASKKIKELQKLMEQTERDIVNKNITQQTIERQKDILSRLLESDKAQRERDKDHKRESNTAKQIENRNLEEFFKYKNQEKDGVVEMLKFQTPSLKSFYNQKVTRYLNNID